MKVFNNANFLVIVIYKYIHVGTCQQNCSTRRHPKSIKKPNRWTECQREILKKSYQANSFPIKNDLDELAKSFNTSRRRIENWFACRRFIETRKGLLPVGE